MNRPGLADSGALGGIGVVNDFVDGLLGTPSNPEGHLQRAEQQLGRHPVRGAPTDNPPEVDVGDERGEAHTRPSRDIGDVHDPELVRPLRGEVALHAIRWPCRRGIGASRDELLAAADPTQPLLAYQQLDRAADAAVSSLRRLTCSPL